jgi:predicted DNA-binding transcriptional regulator AlpA
MSVSSAQAIREVDRRDEPVQGTDETGAVVPGKVLNLAEAAALVRCSRAHLSNVVNGKVHGIPRLPTVRIGRRVLFRRESIEQWIQQVESMTALRPSR